MNITKNKSYKIYKHTFPNKKVYIGFTSLAVEQRWQKGQNYKNQPLIWHAIKKYGWENILHEIIFETSDKTLAENKEKEYISLYNSTNPKFGYNIDKGGLHSDKMSQKTKNKLSKVKKGIIPWNKGKTGIYSKEVLEKISKTAKVNINNKGRFKRGHKGFGPFKYTKILCVETNEIFNSVIEIKNKYPKVNINKIYKSLRLGSKHFNMHWKNLNEVKE